MSLEAANQNTEALQARVKTVEDTLLQEASPVVAALKSRVESLETQLATYGPLLEFLQANHSFVEDLIKRVEPRFKTIEGQIAALQATNENNTFQKDMLRDLKTLAEATKNHSIAKPKIDSPEKFSGKREDWKSFQSQLELYFLAQASQYQSDTAKIMFAISRLGDTAAYKYMEKHIPAFKLDDEERPTIISSLDKFWSVMTKNFGVTDAHIVAES
ncbi:hypothetical protein BGZ68_003748 [Mortierella alpina]|nr:hypothetical protein BGZ68_003748 [Mortierella alpina]